MPFSCSHATVSIHTADDEDPFFGDNPRFVGSMNDIEADYIPESHGHYDHVADPDWIGRAHGCYVHRDVGIASFLKVGLNTKSPQHIGGGA